MVLKILDLKQKRWEMTRGKEQKKISKKTKSNE